MKFTFTIRHVTGRIDPLITQLKYCGHEIGINDDPSTSDIWLYEFWQPNFSDPLPISDEEILKYKGKFLFFSVDDGAATWVGKLSPLVRKRIDGWVTNAIHRFRTDYAPEDMYDRFVLIPLFPIPYRKLLHLPRKNQIIFYATATGGMRDGKNLRVEAARILKNSSLPFIGGIVGTDNPVLNGQYDDVKVDYLPNTQLFDLLDTSTLSLCLSGNVAITYRHFESMRSKCAMISTPVTTMWNWFHDDKMKGSFIPIKRNLANLISVCERALKEEENTANYAETGYQIYSKFYELNPDGTIRKNIWEQIKWNFKKIQIHL